MTTFSAGVAMSVGRVRTNQEDSSFVTNLLDGIACGVFDGMGGHEAGEKASGLAARLCRSWLKRGEPQMRGLLRTVHDELINQLGPGPGTTAVVATFEGGNVTFVWAGDSRLYRWRANRPPQHSLRQLTQDHSGGRNTLTLCLGSESDNGRRLNEPPIEEAYLVGDTYLLCTDGVTNEMDDRFIEQELRALPLPSQETADRIVQYVDLHGGRDNSTAIVVRVLP